MRLQDASGRPVSERDVAPRDLAFMDNICGVYGTSSARAESTYWLDTGPSIRRTVLDAVMAQPPPGSKPTNAADEPTSVPTSPSDLDQVRRTSMAAERTWLAWWRTALGASAGALAVGRFAPELLDVAAWPYILLGCGYASLAVGLLIVGAQRQRELEQALRTGGHVPLQFRTVGLFTVGGVALAAMTVVLVIAQT